MHPPQRAHTSEREGNVCRTRTSKKGKEILPLIPQVRRKKRGTMMMVCVGEKGRDRERKNTKEKESPLLLELRLSIAPALISTTHTRPPQCTKTRGWFNIAFFCTKPARGEKRSRKTLEMDNQSKRDPPGKNTE